MILDFIEIINSSLEFGLKWLIRTVGLFLNFACTFIIIPSNFFSLWLKKIFLGTVGYSFFKDLANPHYYTQSMRIAAGAVMDANSSD